ncbi:hypothetical protein [Marivirga sp.]|uniref:hypothetical protein n=1 Tax=Marivirga sp. TaxID=2018662 RepID=UPI0025F27B7B|nr:hypothetical protein [Marivirga sp.]
MKSNTQIFLENSFFSLLSLPKIIALTKIKALKNPAPLKKKSDCIILGNGPSLSATIPQIETIRNKYDLACVNYFALTEAFQKLKPQHYILNAPELWMNDVEENYLNKAAKLFNTLADSTTWPLNLFIAVSASKSYSWQEKIKKNKNINIVYFNTTPIEGFKSLIKKAIYKGWGMPRPHNVLIPSIVISLRMGYANTYLTGADHSWLSEIWVDDSNNVFLTQKHFYDEKEAKAAPMKKLGKGRRTLPEILSKFTYAFTAYFELDKIAKEKNQQILNATKGSFIDAFDRVKEIPS